MIIITRIVTALTLSLLISACAEESTDENVSTETVNTGNRITIGGSVGDGPVIGATIILKNNRGLVLATSTSDDQANYLLTLDIQTEDFPLLVEASNGIDLVSGTIPDFTLISAIPNISSNQANLNPHSTLIVKTASLMPGGLNEHSLEQARVAVLTKLNFGLDTDLVNNPMTISVDGNNVVTLTHSSEALAEMVRRISRTIGDGTDEDIILDSLAADLTDGVLDGFGSIGTIPLHTAVAHVVSLQVLLEAMLHDLHVNGVPADDALTAAINTIMETSSKPLSIDGSTNINKLMLEQAKAALAAIQTIDSSVTLNDLREVLKELGDEATTEEMINTLAQYSLDRSITSSLDESISETVSSTEEEISAINDAANTYDDETQDANIEIATPIENIFPSIIVTETNQVPTISGVPASSVTVGEAYTFIPVASDPDGDNLNFNVMNLPGWAVFNITSGAITGTPNSTDLGLYEDIVITVSDGSAQASLNIISIMVDAVPVTTSSATLSWTIPTTRTDGSSLSLSEIDGFRIYMGSTEDSLAMTIDLNEGTATSYTVMDLTVGNYVFSVTTYDIDGNESGLSNLAAKRVM